MPIRSAAVALVLSVALVAGCSSSDHASKGIPGEGSTPRSTAPDVPGLTGQWALVSYRAADGRTVPASTVATPTMTFERDGRFTATTGCNQLQGTYAAHGTNATIDPGPSTQSACAGAALAEQEAAFLRTLPMVAGYHRAAKQLTLTDDKGVVLLSLDPALDGLPGTRWTATGVNTGTAVESTALTEKLTASFGAGGRFSGDAGCGTLTGHYQTSGTAGLTITRIFATLPACDPARTTLAQQYQAALKQVVNYGITGDVLTLRDAQGSVQVTLRLNR